MKACERDAPATYAYESDDAWEEHKKRTVRVTTAAFGLEQDGEGNPVSVTNPKTMFGLSVDDLSTTVTNGVQEGYRLVDENIEDVRSKKD